MGKLTYIIMIFIASNNLLLYIIQNCKYIYISTLTAYKKILNISLICYNNDTIWIEIHF